MALSKYNEDIKQNNLKKNLYIVIYIIVDNFPSNLFNMVGKSPCA